MSPGPSPGDHAPPSASRLPALLSAEAAGRVEFLARTAAEKRYWVVIGARQGGLRGWAADSAHYVVDESAGDWIDRRVTAGWLANWNRGRGALPSDHLFAEIACPEGWLAVSAVETADILHERCLHWGLALERADGSWLAVPPLGCVLHDGSVALDPLMGEDPVIALLRLGLDVLGALAARIAAAGVTLSGREKAAKLPKGLIQTRPGQLLVNEWVSVMLK